MSTSEPGPGISLEELQLAARNHGMPLEALRYPVTPTGLHYLLIHYDIPDIDPQRWRLQVDGCALRTLTLSLDDITSRPVRTLPVTMECAGNGRARLEPRPVSQPWLSEAVGTAEWTGTPLRPLLEEAGWADDAVEVVFTGSDRGVEGGTPQAYARSLPLLEALGEDVLLVYGMNGAPLLPQHGAPLRLLVPGWYGMTNVKWLERITFTREPFSGYQNTHAYRFRSGEDDPGEPVRRMAPRALMVPPGVPDFMTRARYVPPGPLRLEGRAWSGNGPVTRVEVSVDGAQSWAEATLGEPLSEWAWHPWSWLWDAAEGGYELCCRATDETGATQPLRPPWNLGGYANNAVQRISVTVTTDPAA